MAANSNRTQVEILREILELALEHSLLSPEFEAEIAPLLQEYAGAEEFLALLERLGDIVLYMAEDAPYLSDGQRKALAADVKSLFSEIKRALGQEGGSASSVEARLARFTVSLHKFAITRLPKDVIEASRAMSLDDVRELIPMVVRDVFGELISQLPFAERVSIESRISRAIEEGIRDLSRGS